MSNKNLQDTYKQIQGDHFPTDLEIKFGDKVLRYEKVGWEIDGELKGLRYGENPGQEAALFRLVNGNLTLGEVTTVQPGKWLASDIELLQSGKHPGKTNITDADNALNILRYFTNEPVVAILKHNNPSGVAIGENLLDAYKKANMADRVAAFGGAIALNQTVDKETAEAIVENYAEVVLAPDFTPEALSIFSTRKNLRVMQIANMKKLKDWVGEVFLDFKSLIDGGLIVQTSYKPEAISIQDIKALPLGYQESKNSKIKRKPTENEYRDMWFGWLVEAGITSNSVIYVKDGVTVGIGTGEQDRVGVAKIARDKAYEKLLDRLCFEKYQTPYNELELKEGKDSKKVFELKEATKSLNGGLKGSVMVSDAFFPFRDGIDVGLDEGVSAIIQPGGSLNDYQSIDACNDANATMIYTGQRSFKH